MTPAWDAGSRLPACLRPSAWAAGSRPPANDRGETARLHLPPTCPSPLAGHPPPPARRTPASTPSAALVHGTPGTRRTHRLAYHGGVSLRCH